MSTKTQTETTSSSETPETILGPLTEERVNQVQDLTVRELAGACFKMCYASSSVILRPVDTSQKQLAESLAEVNITLDDARQLAAEGNALIVNYEDRQAKDATARAATSKLENTRTRTHNQVMGYGNIIRGELGSRSETLEFFGVKRLGGNPGRRKSAKSEDKGGNTQSGSGANGASGSGTAPAGDGTGTTPTKA